jgi:short-subunit dehydrogenase involved in D-alanine esterification of teichoic acids
MPLSAFSLQNKTAFITGGVTGIGFGISKAMIAAGATVIITGRREEIKRCKKPAWQKLPLFCFRCKG